MIPSALEAFARAVADSVRAEEAARKAIYEELLSHMKQEYYEVQLRGKTESEAVREIQDRFGGAQNIAAGFSAVYARDMFLKKMLIAAGLWYLAQMIMVFFGAFFSPAIGSDFGEKLSLLVFGGLNPFSFVFTLFVLLNIAAGGWFVYASVATLAIFAGISWYGARSWGKMTVDAAERLVSGTAILAMGAVVVSFFISYVSLSDSASPVYGVAGFPFRAISFTMAGADTVPFSMWPAFLLNIGIWWIASLLMISRVVRSLTFSKKELRYALIVSSLVMVDLLVWIVLTFD